MSTKPTTTGQSPLVKLALLGSLGIGFFYLNDGLQHLQLRIADLPVQGKAQQAAAAPQADTAVASANLVKNMHPLLVESKNKAATLREGSAADTNLDALFGRDQAQQELDARKKKEADAEKAAKASQAVAVSSAAGVPPVPAALPAIDYFKLLALKVRVQAVMKDGAVINEDFCEIGAEVKSLAYPSSDGTKTLYPRLHSVEGEVVLLTEAGSGVRKIRAKLLH